MKLPDVIDPFDPLPSSQHSCGTSPFQSANHRTTWAISIAVTNYKRGTDSNSLLTVINMHYVYFTYNTYGTSTSYHHLRSVNSGFLWIFDIFSLSLQVSVPPLSDCCPNFSRLDNQRTGRPTMSRPLRSRRETTGNPQGKQGV